MKGKQDQQQMLNYMFPGLTRRISISHFPGKYQRVSNVTVFVRNIVFQLFYSGMKVLRVCTRFRTNEVEWLGVGGVCMT